MEDEQLAQEPSDEMSEDLEADGGPALDDEAGDARLRFH